MSPTRRVVLVVMLGLLAACTRQYESFEPPPLSFADRAPLRLEVASVTVESAYVAPGEPPYVDHLLPLTPEVAARALLEQRLQAVGGPGRVQAVILDASVQEEALETTGGIQGYLTTETAARLEGRLKVRVDQLDAAGLATRSVSTGVQRTRAIPEDTAYAERQRLADDLVRDLVDDLDAGLMANMRDSFADILQP